jgi:hypothetical protein
MPRSGGEAEPPRPPSFWRLEAILVALFLACWAVVLLSWLGLVTLRGNFPLGLYPLYSLASVLGWSAGNLYVHRGRRFPDAIRRRVLLVYYLGPQGLVYLLRFMAPLAAQQAAPLVPVWAFGVFSIFFLVPVKLIRVPKL